MSTFDGIVAEFPSIRIDYFRPAPDSKPALAYFLSHVHSDHLTGLESCKSPFIYCSPATRDIILRLEKYPHRMNFAKGILETRKQTYRHLKNLLKAIPLETPTVIELCPGEEIRVTLFDANHCVGAVMFLIEGGGNAVIYTGDVRSEVWWVNALMRHPVLLPYVCGKYAKEPIKPLDAMYLDTTFVVAGKEDCYVGFSSKAAGLRELLRKVARYPPDTLFYLDAWTFGYEDVWQALATFLNSRVHVDQYQFDLHNALATGAEPKATEATKLFGFNFGNHFQKGCLSRQSDGCRIHSCERGTGCEIWDKEFVRITPIVSRHNGAEIAELGAGGGQGDLNQQHELEVFDTGAVGQLMALCASKLQDQTQSLSGVLEMLTSVINDHVRAIKLEDLNAVADSNTVADQTSGVPDLDGLPLEKLVPALVKIVTKQKLDKARSGSLDSRRSSIHVALRADGLPKRISFPYSRHSSYHELYQLVEAFKPKNIHPCTVDEANWTRACSMNTLFGQVYGEQQRFRHDEMMFAKKGGTLGDAQGISRPTSSETSFDEYPTPNAHTSASKHDLPSDRTRSTRISVSKGRHSHSPNSVFSSRQVGHERRKQGDQSRSANVDHYSPPRDGKKRKSSPERTSNQTRSRTVFGSSTNLHQEARTIRGVTEVSRTTFRESMPPEWQFDEHTSLKKHKQHRQSSDYGRLSPPPVLRSGVENYSDAPQQLNSSDSRRKDYGGMSPLKSRNIKTTEPLNSHSPVRTRLAFRQEVYNAVLGKDGASWSEIGLVSVNGHQAMEEELSSQLIVFFNDHHE